MINLKGRIHHLAVVAGLTAAAFLLSMGATSAWAEPGMRCHSEMGMDGHGMHGMGGGMGFGMRGMSMEPHNAAEHFLKMATALNLSDAQIKQLTKLRDGYIEENATAEEQLKAAYEDLGRALYGDNVDMNAVNALFEKIGKLDGQLWHAYAQQLHDIKAMLTAEQKQSLDALWPHGPHGMRGDMPMHNGMGM